MKEERIFIGDIRICTCYTKIKKNVNPKVELEYVLRKHDLYKESVMLMKARNGLYAEIDGHNIRELALIYNASIGQNLMKTVPEFEGELYVDQNSLKVYNQRLKLVKRKYR